MRAVIVNPEATGKLELGEVEAPVPERAEALVQVKVVSLNRGEVGMAQNKPAGTRIGWDIAGVVEREAADGSGPKAGQRVAGFLPSADGWAEQVAVNTRLLAPIPDDISDEVAAALPVAGLTALRGLDRGVRVAGRTVAITGATGGVGMFAVQIARAMGARVVAQVRRAEQVEAMKALGAHDVVVTEDGIALEDYGPYAIAFDGLGGVVLKNLIGMLDNHGVAVTYGGTAAYTVEFPIFGLNRTASIYGFSLYQEVDEEPGGVSLARLMRLVQDGQIKVEIGRKVSWGEVGAMATALLNRAYPGKGVMIVG